MNRIEGRKSEISQVASSSDGESMYVVHLYENNQLIQTRELPGKSRHYAEDVAENWETGIIQLLTG